MNCRESVDIYISATNLQRMDLLSKSDPFARLFYMGPSPHSGPPSAAASASKSSSSPFTTLGDTETKQNNSNPEFSTKFSIYYYFECTQQLKVEIHDSDGSSNNGSSQFMGRTLEFTLSQVVCAVGGKFKTDLLNDSGKVVGQVLLFAEKVVRQQELDDQQSSSLFNIGEDIKEKLAFQRFAQLPYHSLKQLRSEIPNTIPVGEKVIKFTCCAKNLDKKDVFGKSDPYFHLEKEVASRKEKIYHSEVIQKNLNPNWSTFELNLDLFNHDFNKPIHVKCFDHDDNSNDDLIGEFSFTLDQVMNQGKKQFELIEPTIASKKKNYQNSGLFEFSDCQWSSSRANPELAIYQQVLKQKENEIFLDYLFGGCTISVSVGIDFTGSNMKYTLADSLHHLSTQPNQYQQALTKVLSILEPYDVDKMYGAYGYGACIDKNEMEPMFNLSLEKEREELHGTQEILTTYANAIPRLVFGDMGQATNPKTKKVYSGDDFYRVIEHVVEKTPNIVDLNKQFYNILLLIIDGDSFDMQGTIDAIIDANDKPISIIIIGVGISSFPYCRKFDADDTPLVHSKGHKMSRDIVQFVCFRECESVEELASQVLAEIPKQMINYFLSKNIVPNPRPVYYY